MKYSYFPGCSVRGTTKEYEESAKAVSKVLDIELDEISDWNCCGCNDAVYSYKPTYAIALAARNLALAEKTRMEVTTLCTSCYFTLSSANKMMKDNPATKNKVDEALKKGDLTYNGGVRIRHFAEVLLSDVGFQKIKEKIKVSLKPLKVASYYGCLLVRPPNICNFDNPEHPTRLDELAESLGASKVDYCAKTRCCGAGLSFTDEDIMLRISKDILLSAKNAGADCIMTACTMCHFNLDAKQKQIESHFKIKINLPVLHFTQLMGLAFGLTPKQLGLQRNCVSPTKITDLLVGEISGKS